MTTGTGTWGKELPQQFSRPNIVSFNLEDLKESGPLPASYQLVKDNLLDRLAFPGQQIIRSDVIKAFLVEAM